MTEAGGCAGGSYRDRACKKPGQQCSLHLPYPRPASGYGGGWVRGLSATLSGEVLHTRTSGGRADSVTLDHLFESTRSRQQIRGDRTLQKSATTRVAPTRQQCVLGATSVVAPFAHRARATAPPTMDKPCCTTVQLITSALTGLLVKMSPGIGAARGTRRLVCLPTGGSFFIRRGVRV